MMWWGSTSLAMLAEAAVPPVRPRTGRRAKLRFLGPPAESVADDDAAFADRVLASKAAMTESSIAAVMAYDDANRLVYCNPAALKLCGAEDTNELQGTGFPRVKMSGKAADLPLPDYLVSDYLLGDGYAEVLLEVKPAKVLACLVSGDQLHDENGELVLSHASVLDVTEMHAHKARLEENNAELVAAKEEAEMANRVKSEFLAAMSHELRTPLNAIIGFSEIIASETLGPAGSGKYRDYAVDIHDSGQHLLALINDLLDLSKVESGLDEILEDDIDIADLARSVFILVEKRAAAGGIALRLDLADGLPVLRADERKLKQILVNLLSNAVKFTEAGGAVTLRIACPDGSGHVFRVIDTGIGIAPEDIDKAFSQFGQVDSDLNRKYQGTGLGLPLTKALVELHGGTLDLESEIGVGTTVTVELPAERVVDSIY